MNWETIRPALTEAGFENDQGPDDHSFWIRVPAEMCAVRFAVHAQQHRLELVFRFGHVRELDRDTALDLLYYNHETTHFRLALNDRMDLFLLGTWPPDDLDADLLVWLVKAFSLSCERILEDVAELIE